MAELKYKRVLLKLSGEALAGEQKTGIDPETVGTICKEIGGLLDMGVELALVIGGGNIFRGLSGSAKGMERSSADYMGMLATVLNALAVQDMLEKFGYPTRVLSAIDMQEVCEPFIRRRAMRHLEKGRVVICAAGTGNPYFTTDTTAALRGMELQCDAIIMNHAKVRSIPEISANHVDASLIHEAAIGKIAGEQILKLMTLGLTAEEAEQKILEGFLR